MSEMNKKEIVEELNEISNLYAQRLQLEQTMFSVMQKEEKDQKEQRFKIATEVSKSAGESENTFKVKTPALSPIVTSSGICDRPSVSKKKVIKGAIFELVFLVDVTALLIMIITGYDSVGISVLTGALFFISGILFFLNSGDLFSFVNYLDSHDKWHSKLSNTDFEAVDKDFIQECKKIDNDFNQVEKEYTKLLLEKLDELEKVKDKINERFYDEKVEILKKVNSIDDELKQHTVLSPDYYDKAANIAKILNNNRADTLKEALNLAIEEARREEEEQNRQREKEAELMLEAARVAAERTALEEQTRIMERQAEDSRRAAEEQEKILKQQAEEMRRAEDKRRIEDAFNKREEKIARETARRNAYRQCENCANKSGCRVIGTVHCGAFVPRNL